MKRENYGKALHLLQQAENLKDDIHTLAGISSDQRGGKTVILSSEYTGTDIILTPGHIKLLLVNAQSELNSIMEELEDV